MGLARKGSRTIHADGRDYRWVVSPDCGYMCLVIEHDSGNGQRLKARVSYGDESGAINPSSTAHGPVTPMIVRRAIELAISDGWKPEQGGLPPFRIEDADERLWGT